MQSLKTIHFRQTHQVFAVGILVLIGFALSASLALAMGRLDEGVDPLPQGCIHPTPPGEEAPLCCLSGFVYVNGVAVKDAAVTISDAQGEVGTAWTTHYPGQEIRPYYYVDLTKLTRPITPTDVITLQVSYHGISSQLTHYTIQPGGQQFHFNLYQTGALPLANTQPGVADVGKFQEITGVAVDGQGDLYLWDSENFRMMVLRPVGDGTWLERSDWQREIGFQPQQIRGVPHIAIDHQRERVYLADPYKQGIVIYTTDGDFTGKIIPAPANTWSLAVDGVGNIYAITLFDGLYKFSPDGKELKHIFEDDLVKAIGKLPTGSPIDRTIAVSPQGTLFVARDIPNGISKFSSDLITETFHLSQPITRPAALVVDDANNLFVFDRASFQLHAFDSNGNHLERAWSQPPVSQGSGVYLALSGEFIYLVGGYDGKIVQYSKQGGGALKSWGGFSDNSGSIGTPSDVVIAADQSLFFPDPWSGRINQIKDNQIIHSWQVLGAAGSYNTAALALDASGALIATVNANSLQRFHLEGANLISDTQPWNESTLGKFSYPTGLAVDKHGAIFVGDQANHNLQVVHYDSTTKTFVAITSSTGIVPGTVLTTPLGIAVDDRGDPTIVYVIDTTYNHIVKLTFDGANLSFVSTIGSSGYNPGQFAGPRRLTVAADGSLWVTDTAGRRFRVHHFNPNNLTEWQSYGVDDDPVWDAYGIAVTKDANQQDLVYLASWSYGLISSFTSMTESDPIATITHCSSEDLLPGQTLTCTAVGQDGDDTDIIQSYTWTTTTGLAITTANPQVTIPTTSGATTASTLGPGLHTLHLQVQDNEGVWSQPATRLVFVDVNDPATPPDDLPVLDPAILPTPPTTCPVGQLWTMLLYLDADYKNDGDALLSDYHRVLNELKSLNHACVQIALQIDGPASIGKPETADTERWLIQSKPIGIVTKVEVGEQRMDTPEALADFLKWGQHALPADHYYLAIANHGNAFQGIAFDHTSGPSGSAYLTPSELRTALSDPGVLPIEIVQLDACSMALLDIAYDVRSETKVNYLIASQYIGWSYFAYADYAHYITQWTDAQQLATSIVDRYAYLATRDKLPFTLSALDLTRVGPLKNGISQLAIYLKAWLDADTDAGTRHQQLFNLLRNQSQFFDSNSNYLNTPRDAYVDLKDFVLRIQQAALTEDVTTAATAILSEFNRADAVVLHARHSSTSVHLPDQYAHGALIGFTQANGISLYYPAEGDDLLALPADPATGDAIAASAPLSYTQIYADYLSDKLFDFSSEAGWDKLLQAAYGLPTGELAPPTDPLAPADVPRQVLYLPVVIKQ
ncbi:MAG: clostripain-related cysteine peptidase [Caldilineaceae bacterium]